jgi:hypothetical protein
VLNSKSRSINTQLKSILSMKINYQKKKKKHEDNRIECLIVEILI